MEKREPKTAPVQTAAKSAAEVKEETAAVKETAVKAEAKDTAKKETAKKETAAKKTTKKTPAKKTESKKAEKIEEIYLQFHGQEIFTKDVMERAKQAYIAEGHRESSIKSIRLYIKPEENMAYYVINEKIAGGVTL